MQDYSMTTAERDAVPDYLPAGLPSETHAVFESPPPDADFRNAWAQNSSNQEPSHQNAWHGAPDSPLDVAPEPLAEQKGKFASTIYQQFTADSSLMPPQHGFSEQLPEGFKGEPAQDSLKKDREEPLFYRFDVQLYRRAGDKLGVSVCTTSNSQSLEVSGLTGDDGIVGQWNRENPSLALQAGDLITGANGLSGDASVLVQECQKEDCPLILTVARLNPKRSDG